MTALIYQPTKTAMQSGLAKTQHWLLVFERQKPAFADPLTGWTGSVEPDTQIRLKFPTRAAAEAYARQEGLSYRVQPPFTRKKQHGTYADNFSYDRIEAWTH